MIFLTRVLYQVFRIRLEFQESECQNPIPSPSPEFDPDVGRGKLGEIVNEAKTPC